jgi:hypothetical protein
MGLNISTDMSIITWTIARATMGRCLRAESVRWSTMKNFAAKQCMTRMVMRRRTDTDNAHLDTRAHFILEVVLNGSQNLDRNDCDAIAVQVAGVFHDLAVDVAIRH